MSLLHFPNKECSSIDFIFATICIFTYPEFKSHLTFMFLQISFHSIKKHPAEVTALMTNRYMLPTSRHNPDFIV